MGLSDNLLWTVLPLPPPLHQIFFWTCNIIYNFRQFDNFSLVKIKCMDGTNEFLMLQELSNLPTLELIQNDGSPSARKLFILWNPIVYAKTVRTRVKSTIWSRNIYLLANVTNYSCWRKIGAVGILVSLQLKISILDIQGNHYPTAVEMENFHGDLCYDLHGMQGILTSKLCPLTIIRRIGLANWTTQKYEKISGWLAFLFLLPLSSSFVTLSMELYSSWRLFRIVSI